MGGGRVERGETRREGGVCVCGAECCGVGGVTFLPERTLEQYHPPATIIEKRNSNVDVYADNDIDKIPQTHCNQMVCRIT